MTNGYAATSIKSVAAAAAVSEQTIYNSFGDKPSLLFAVGERITSGELASAATTERDLLAELQAEPNPANRIRIVAQWSRMVWEQGMLEFESMLLDAATTDPRVADVAEAAVQQKYEENKEQFALVFPEETRRSDIDLDDALDLLFAIDSAAFVRILIDDRGWSYDKYEHWLADTLHRLFLDTTD